MSYLELVSRSSSSPGKNGILVRYLVAKKPGQKQVALLEGGCPTRRAGDASWGAPPPPHSPQLIPQTTTSLRPPVGPWLLSPGPNP